MKKYWNRGLTTEAAEAFVDFAAHTLGACSLRGLHATENPASGKVMEKLGFVYYGSATCVSFDGARVYPAKEYLLNMTKK